jgi:hypothetical protein
MRTGTNDTSELARLRDILDAWGGDPGRWPDAEREPALALLARSADARRLLDDALRLDAALDLLPAADPSPGLEDRIVAAARRAPQDASVPGVTTLADARARRAAARAPRRGLLLAAALPLAAAAALALWIARTDRGTTAPQFARAGGDAATPHVASMASEAELLAALGSYSMPGDALLELSGLDDVYDADPWHGCSDGDLGCVKNDSLPFEPLSEGDTEKEVRALS